MALMSGIIEGAADASMSKFIKKLGSKKKGRTIEKLGTSKTINEFEPKLHKSKFLSKSTQVGFAVNTGVNIFQTVKMGQMQSQIKELSLKMMDSNTNPVVYLH